MEDFKSALKRDPLGGEILDEILDTVSSSLPLFLSLALAFLSRFLSGVIHAPPSLRAAVFIGSVSARRPCLSSVRSRGLPSLPLYFFLLFLSLFLLLGLCIPLQLSQRERDLNFRKEFLYLNVFVHLKFWIFFCNNINMCDEEQINVV